MKITPFQQALRDEMNRLERFSHTYEMPTFSLNLQQPKTTKNKHFLLQFFRHALSF